MDAATKPPKSPPMRTIQGNTAKNIGLITRWVYPITFSTLQLPKKNTKVAMAATAAMAVRILL